MIFKCVSSILVKKKNWKNIYRVLQCMKLIKSYLKQVRGFIDIYWKFGF